MSVDGYIFHPAAHGASDPDLISRVDQRRAIESSCSNLGLDLATVHEEQGNEPPHDLPALAAALDRVGVGAADGLIVARFDGFGRGLLHGICLLDRIDQLGGFLVAALDDFDTRSTAGRFFARAMCQLAGPEVRRRSDTRELDEIR